MKDNNQNIEGKQTLTSQQKQKMKKYAVFALMFIVFGASLWLIFAPSKDEKAKTEATTGFNADHSFHSTFTSGDRQHHQKPAARQNDSCPASAPVRHGRQAGRR